MEINRLTLPPIGGPGEVTTFYSFESGAARSIALADSAVLLAGRQNATTPVLMIDWDTEAPGLHHLFPTRDERYEQAHADEGRGVGRGVGPGAGGGGPSGRHGGARGEAGRAEASRPGLARPGLLEYFEACREQLKTLGRTGGDDHEERARLVLEAIDWEAHVERVDQSRTLYLMRAGCFDDSFGERADRMDWDGLFAACPALFRAFAAHLTRHFRHVLIDCRGGRSAAVSVCTTLLPDRLVGLFTPNGRSLEGLAGVVTRAIEYRCSHEEAQRPLLVYPVPCGVDGVDAERRLLWRRGDLHKGVAGYQPRLEQLLRNCYGMAQVSLDSYLDEVQLHGALACGAALHVGALPERDGDRLSQTRAIEALLGWAAAGRFPWQSRLEIELLDAVEAARARLAANERREDAAGHEGHAGGHAAFDPNAVLLARELLRLGELYLHAGRLPGACDCFAESTTLRQRLLGDAHADTRASRAALAAALRDSGRLPEARQQYEALVEHCAGAAGFDDPETLAARSGLAATLARQEEFGAALGLHDAVLDACERLYGPDQIATLDAVAAQARTLALQGEYSRARMLYEQVLEGRQRMLGTEHEDTLRCTQQLATLLRDMGDLGNARKLQESVVRVRERQAGMDAAVTLQAREALAEIFAAQGDLGAVRDMQQSLAVAREQRLGSEHPDTLGVLLRLASTLSQQGELEEARRLQQHVVSLHERLRGMDDHETLRSKQMLAQTLSSQGHSVAARRLEQSVEEGGNRLLQLRAMSAGAHDSPAGLPGASLPGTRDPGGGRAPDGRASSGPAGQEPLEHKLGQLHKLVEGGRAREARQLADSLREIILRPSVAQPLRRRGVALIKQVYQDDNDKDALLAFAEDEVASLEGALIEAAGGRPLAMR
ncbi:tetratricopeptide repeat protein [Massilia litorea]|uniref:Tetratricopeptide repeat protein n=1 Tax=Massilia litorea TaxID=2769491 RepID=A0A7L9TYN1_9BURK|nr:tetratricopeptide repeat protein [Massilia litorea]QOL47883.1 tetratricopeptide repeat protein [Massilia litorea]